MKHDLISSALDPKRLEDFLGVDTLPILRQAAQLAEAQGWQLYLVGGPVRDLLLGLPATDLDLLVEGNAIELAQELATILNARLLGHAQFGTATLSFEHSDLYLDIVTARREYYAHIAALPIVEPSNLYDDLLRRDFTINSMALGLNAASFARLYDACGAQADLERGLMRVLHDQSFMDDPTRMIRMARIAARLGFAIEEHTHLLLQTALDRHVMRHTTPVRVLHELELCLAEAAPDRVLALMDRLGILTSIHPVLHFNQQLAHHLKRSESVFAQESGNEPITPRNLADLRLLLLLYNLDTQARQDFASYFNLSTHRKQCIQDIDSLHEVSHLLSGHELDDSVLDRVLHSIHDLVLQTAMIAANPLIAMRIQRYRTQLRPAQIALTGNSLRAMQIPPGPLYRVLLEGLRAAMLDGQVRSEEEQRAWVRRQLAGADDEMVSGEGDGDG